ncbi:hypothetical protein [Rummeliibacillus stabekisii]|uniref:hypothetical protein n=1 Tax=Rummeliibacillus stabekisii TaxID=241244 RepID=UPI00116A8DAB|nr:hypothetical protein [Rummeliibacillus stabekisii]MBB5168978.1 hypothetical protein [Rummeliibacillus stabekisii]GEL05618.1 hypothetical protein RST01_22450 [Rummeliibacillus stabekisii]
MKYGVYGKYMNIEYEINKDEDNNIIIITEDKTEIDGTFKDTYNSGVFSKIVKPEELTECINIKPYGIIMDKKLEISNERENEFQIVTSDLLIGTQLNLQRVDRDEWKGWVSKLDVTFVEEKKPFNPFDLA